MRLTATLTILLVALSCRESDGSYQRYAGLTASTGDSALSAVSSYLTLDSTASVRYDSAAARTLDLSDSKLIGKLNAAGVGLNRKMLAEIAISDPVAFQAIVKA